MKFVQFLVIFVCFAINANAQLKDTLNLQQFEIIKSRLPLNKSFKKTVIDSLQLRQVGGKNLSDLLQNYTPIFIKSYGQGGLATPSFRGTGAAHTQIYWNGIRINNPMLGMSDLSTLPIFFVDGVTLHHGAASIIDGDGGLGGSILLSNSTQHQNKLEISQQLGSYNLSNSSVKTAYKWGKWSFVSSAFYKKATNNFKYKNIALPLDNIIARQQNAALKQGGGMQQIKFNPNKNNTFSLNVIAYRSDRQIPQLINTIGLSTQKQRDESLKSVLEWGKRLKKGNLIIRGAYLFDQINYVDSLTHQYFNNRYHGINNQLWYSYQKTNNWQLKLGYTTEYVVGKTKGYTQNRSRLQFSPVVDVEKKLAANLLGNLTIREVISNQFTSKPITSVGFTFMPQQLKGIQLKTNFSNHFHAPTLNDLYWKPGGNTNLIPETGWNGELGFEVNRTIAKNQKIYFEITAFYSLIDNWILWSPLSSSIWTAQNLKKVRNKGLELALNYTAKIKGYNISLFSNYSFTKSTNQKGINTSDNSVGKQLIYVPVHNLNAGIDVKRKNILLSMGYRFTSDRYISTDNNWYLPYNNLFWLSGSYKIKMYKTHQINIAFRIDNLFNEQYQSIAWRPMPGRNFLVSLKYIFK